MKKLLKATLLLAAVSAIGIAALACGDDDKPQATEYNVTYSVGEGTGTAPVGGKYKEGDKFMLPKPAGMEKVGCTFDSWLDNETADLEVTEYYWPDVEYTMPAHDVTFVAQWRENQYTLTYDIGDEAKYSSNDEAAVAPTGGEYYYGETVTLATAIDFYVDGKAFSGWSDGTKIYPMGADYTIPAGNTTLTAVWSNPLTKEDIIGKWTSANGDVIEIADDTLGNDGADCAAVMDREEIVYIYLDINMVESRDSSRTWAIYGTPNMLILTEVEMNTEGEDSVTIRGSIVYTVRTALDDDFEFPSWDPED